MEKIVDKSFTYSPTAVSLALSASIEDNLTHTYRLLAFETKRII